MKKEWWTKTFNIIEGKCAIGCKYCWAEKMKQRFNLYNAVPRFNEKVFQKFKNFKGTGRIFVNNMIESLGRNDNGWMQKIIDNAPKQCISVLLTKMPCMLYQMSFTQNWWVGTTITDLKRGFFINCLFQSNAKIKFISFEPLLEDCAQLIVHDISWVIIGGLSPKPIHEKKWIDNMIAKCREYKIPVWIKQNAKYDKIVREVPE